MTPVALLAISDLVLWVGTGCLVVLTLTLLLVFARLLMGPTNADRVIAVDAMTVVTAAIVALYAILTNEPMLIRVTLTLALFGFLVTVALARLIALRGRG